MTRTINYMKQKEFKGIPVYTQRIVDYVADLSYEDLPKDVVKGMKMHILNVIGCALGAQKYKHCKLLAEFARIQGSKEESSVVGTNFKTNSINAAFVNGGMPYILDLDGHGGDLTFWPALAFGEKVKASGKDLITASVTGFNIYNRVSAAMNYKMYSLYNRRFHHCGVSGCFGSAASAGKILGLDKAKLTNALGLAGMGAGSLMAWLTDPTEMTRTLSPGLGALNGATAALLAQIGYPGPPAIFEGNWNAFDAFSGQYNRENLTKGLTKEEGPTTIRFKRHASCSFTHEALDALFKMMKEHNISGEHINEITVRLATHRAPIVAYSAIQSHNMRYIIAIGAFDKEITAENMLEKNKREDPKVRKLWENIKLISDPKLGYTNAAVVELTMNDGTKLVQRVDETLYSVSTHEDLRKKFIGLAKVAVSKSRVSQIWNIVNKLEMMKDIRELGDLLRIG